MPLDPQVAALLAQVAALNLPKVWDLPIDVARRNIELGAPLTAGVGAQDVNVSEGRIPGPAGPMRVRLYRPHQAPAAGAPLVAFYHGGGFALCSVVTHDAICRDLASASGAVFASVDYRLAPENPFPAAVDDSHAAFLWLTEHAEELGCAPDQVAVAGDSAGGNLAAVTCLVAKERGGPAPVFQLLVYPGTDMTLRSETIREYGSGFGLDLDAMQWFVDSYAVQTDRTHPHMSPVFADDLSGLPPAHVVTMEFDPLRAEGERYVERLRQAGVPTTHVRYPGLIHGCLGTGAVVGASRQVIADCANALRAGLRGAIAAR